MSFLSISLICLSSVIHATWNGLLKNQKSKNVSFVLLFTFCFAIYSIPIIIYFHDLIPLMPKKALILSMFTGLFMSLYVFSLYKSYQYGDISFVYPLIRAVPIILVVLISTLFGIGEAITFYALIGMLLIVIGCLMLPMKSLTDFKASHYLNIVVFLAMISAAGTAGYSIVDDIATESITNTATSSDMVFKMTLLYAAFEFTSTFCWTLLLSLIFKRDVFKQILDVNIKPKLRIAAMVGFGSFSAYFLILLAMPNVANISYVVAFRQLSIPLGAILGVIFFKEKCNYIKTTGLIVLLIGLILVSLG